MPDDRPNEHDRNSGNAEVRFLDDLSEEYHSDASAGMEVDNEGLLLEEDDILEEDEIEEEMDESSEIHSGEYEYEDDSAPEGSQNGDEQFADDDSDDRRLEGLFSIGGARSALEALTRLRRLAPPANDGEDWNDEDRLDEDLSGAGRLGIPLLEALRGSLVNPRINGIMRSLRSNDNSEILAALNGLSSVLLIPQGGMGNHFIPVDALSKALVDLLRSTDTIEVQVMTARAMSQLIDSGLGGNATKALINAGAVPAMRDMFENVFYIDLIEQLIHVLKPLAVAAPHLVLKSGCLLPCVTTLDFFNEYIQREIMAAIDACAKDVDSRNASEAKTLLAVFPETPNDNVVGTYSLLVVAIAKLNEPDFAEIATPKLWDNLIQYVQPGTPQIGRVMRAVAHTATRCPQYVNDRYLLANLVQHTLVQDVSSSNSDLFTKLISVPKDVLFAGLKLLQALLPLPPAVAGFNGPYRKESRSLVDVPDSELRSYAETTVPLAIATYSASTNTPVQQLAILIVMQAVNALKGHSEFQTIVEKLSIITFVGQIISEGTDHLALAVGGLDIAWDLSTVEGSLRELAGSGLNGDLELYIKQPLSEPIGQFTTADDLTPVASFMSQTILCRISKVQESIGSNTSDLINLVKGGEYDVKDLMAAPLPDLIRANLLEALDSSPIERQLSDEMVSLLQSAVIRLERFELQLTGSRAKSIEEVLSRLIYVKLIGRNGGSPEESWAVSVSAFAAVRSLEDFVRNRLKALTLFNEGPHFSPETISRPEHSDGEERYSFWVGDERIPSDVSVLKAIQGQHGVPVLKYQKIEKNDEEAESPVLQDKSKETIKEPTLTALRLLRRLAQENERRGEIVSWEKFRSAKLTAKLSRQLADVLAIAASMLPQWAFDTVHEYPFLYPLKVRLQFVQLTSFGMGRNLRLLRRLQQDNHDDDDDEPFPDEGDTSQILGHHKHQKFRLSRENILEGALKLLEHSSKNPAVVEVMFFGEEGTGKGPTQEFFVLASQALSHLSLGLWRETPEGLYPQYSSDPSESVLRAFRGAGMLIARALLDKRILDFHFNPAFFEAVLSDSGPTIEKLSRVDPRLAASLDKLLDTRPKELEDIGLDFTLPGTDIELIPGGKDIEVTAENLGDYAHMICDYIVGFGISKQIEAFRSGFSDTIPISALRSFMMEELATLCGADRDEDWSLSTLKDAFTADHGYQMSSAPVQQLFSIISKFDRAERRKFLMFATGSPHLPVGGFKALNPPFTVVIKHPDNEDLEVDQYLPSVMTCANYFKLPPYSSADVMRRQLTVAMSEGSDAFLLS